MTHRFTLPPVTIQHTDREAKYVHGPRLPAAVQANRFEDHSCWGCRDGQKPCQNGHPNRCDLPHARND
jgi:hypothetical protein